MKKIITTALLLVCLMFALTACGKKTSVNVRFRDDQYYSVVQAPGTGVFDSWQVKDDSGFSFVTKKDGQYTVVVRGYDDEKEYTAIFTVKDGQVDMQTDEDSPMSLTTK